MYLHLVDVLRDQCMWIYLAQHFRYLKWRNPHLYKLYGYGLCEGKPTPKIAENKVQYLHFRYLELLVNTSPIDPSTGTQAEQRCQQREIWGLVSRVWSSSHWCQVGLGMRSVIGKMLGKPLGIFHTILAKDQPSKPTNQPNKITQLTQQDPRWWQLKHVLFSPRSLGKWNPIWRAYFSDGLVQPPTRR